MLDDLACKRIQILRERRGLSRPVLAGMSASWLKGIERGTNSNPQPSDP